MDKETIKIKLKAELVLFQIYSLFLIGLITGITGLLLKENFYNDKIILTLIYLGCVFLIIVLISFFKSLYQIKKLTKYLKK